MNGDTDVVKGTDNSGKVIINDSKDFEQRPDIGTVQNLEDGHESKEEVVYD